MKRTPPLIAITFGLLPLTSMLSPGVELFSDDFTYADGSLTDAAGWAGIGGTAGDLLVSSGQAVVQHGFPSEDAQAEFTAQTTGIVYYGLDFSVADLGAPYSGSDNEYFVTLKDSGFNFTGRVDIVPPSSTGDFSVGVASADSTADATWGSDLTFGLTYRLVVKHDIDTNQSTLWIDPTAEGDTSIVGDDAANVRTVFAILLRQSDSSENETVLVDNLVVATTFSEALGTVPTETLTVALSSTSVAEDAGAGQVDVTVTRTGDTTSALDVTLTSGDTSEAVIASPNVQIPAGLASETFTMAIDIVDDSLVDGDQSLAITASAAGFIAGSETLTVTDAGDALTLVINEIYSAVDATDGDANGDGSVSFPDDEFIEIVNYGPTTVDLSLHKLTDASRDIHFFPFGTTLDSGCALVVFGGGQIFDGASAGVFGNAEVQKSSEGLLFLTDGGDTVSIVDDTDTTIFTVVIPDLSSSTADGSYNLDPDGTVPVGPPAYSRHVALSGMATEQFSPGTTVSGTAFCPVPSQALTLTVNNGTVAEDGGAGVATATVSIPSALGDILPVYLETGDAGELVPQLFEAIILAGETEATFELDAVNDTAVDGTQTVTLSAHAPGYANGTTTVDVTDDGDEPPFTQLVINELDADQPTPEDFEFVELFNLTGAAESLNGLTLVLINGSSDTVYDAIDLSGQTIEANGFFVIGEAAVPNVDLSTLNSLQNGPDAVAVYVGSPADFPNGLAASAITNQLVDAVVYGTSDPDDTGLLAVFGGTQADEGPTNNTTSVSRDVDGTGSFVAQAPTPGETNVITDPVALAIAASSFNFATNEVVLTLVGLDAENGVYLVESSTDLNQVDGWAPVGGVFFATSLNVVETSPGVYEVTITDADLGTEGANYYRVTEATPE